MCGFFWHSAATVSIAHCTQRTWAAKKRGKKRKRENRGENIGMRETDVLVLYRVEGLGLLDRAYYNGR